MQFELKFPSVFYVYTPVVRPTPSTVCDAVVCDVLDGPHITDNQLAMYRCLRRGWERI